MTALPRNTIIIGDARKRLRELPTASVDCVITSPPYFAVRDYGHSRQIGHEANVVAWVNELRRSSLRSRGCSSRLVRCG